MHRVAAACGSSAASVLRNGAQSDAGLDKMPQSDRTVRPQSHNTIQTKSIDKQRRLFVRHGALGVPDLRAQHHRDHLIGWRRAIKTADFGFGHVKDCRLPIVDFRFLQFLERL